MKKLNKKGFTLIELIATIAVLGIIMMVAVPNVTSIIDKNKRTQYINDAKKLAILAKYKFESSNLPKPTSRDCYLYMFRDLDKTNLSEAPNGGKYMEDYSYVVIKYNSSSMEYDYFVHLVEEYSVGTVKYYRGVKAKNTLKGPSYKALGKDEAKMEYVTESFTDLSKFNGRTSDDASEISREYSCTIQFNHI